MRMQRYDMSGLDTILSLQRIDSLAFTFRSCSPRSGFCSVCNGLVLLNTLLNANVELGMESKVHLTRPHWPW